MASYKQDIDVANDKGVEITTMHYISISTEPEQDERVKARRHIVLEQREESFCQPASSTNGLPGSKFNCGRHVSLVLDGPIEVAFQKVIPTCLEAHSSYNLQFARPAGHSGQFMTRCAEKITDRSWWRTLTGRKLVQMQTEETRRYPKTHYTTISFERPTQSSHDEHSEIFSKTPIAII